MTGDVGIGQAFAALWPILLALGGGYGALLLYIRQLNGERIADREKSEQRAWELVTALRAEAAESNRVIDKLADTVRELREAIRAEAQARRR